MARRNLHFQGRECTPEVLSNSNKTGSRANTENSRPMTKRPSPPGFPDDSDHWLCHARAGRLDEAIQSLQHIVERDPQNLEVRGQVIRFATQKGDYATVIYQLLDCAELLALAGDKQGAMDRYQAILRLEETVQPSPHHRADMVWQVRNLVSQVKPEIYLRLGEFRLEQGRLDQAHAYLAKSLELKPATWDTHMALARVYLARGEHREAIRPLQEVLRLTQEDGSEAQAQAYQYLGQAFAAQGQSVTDVLPWLERAARLWAQQTHSLTNARVCYEEILALAPDHAEAREALDKLP